MEYIIVTTMVIGVVEAVRAAFDRNWRTVATIVLAGLVGAVCGFFSVEGLTVFSGIAVGLSASGAVAVAKRVG